MTITLCGFTRCGKSTLGRALAKRNRWRFLDTDDLLSRRYFDVTGKDLQVRNIYRELGEVTFRKLEHSVVKDIDVHKKCVIASGGGVAININNVNHLKSLGLLVYLKLPFEILFGRIERSSDRPAFLQDGASRASFEAHFIKREPIYETSADIVLELQDLSRKQILQRLCETGGRRGQ
jgi:shikimate kinase